MGPRRSVDHGEDLALRDLEIDFAQRCDAAECQRTVRKSEDWPHGHLGRPARAPPSSAYYAPFGRYIRLKASPPAETSLSQSLSRGCPSLYTYSAA